MSSMNLPLEIYDVLERKLGRDDAMIVAKSIEVSLSHVEERSREIAQQRKLEAKDELKIELRDELATKADLAKVEARFERLDKKFSLLFAATIFTVIFLNQNALEFLARILGLIK